MIRSSTCLNMSLPVGKHGNSYSSFIQIPLVSLEGPVAIKVVRVSSSLQMGAIVGGEYYQGILCQTQNFQFLHDFPHLVIQHFYHRSKCGPWEWLRSIAPLFIPRMLRSEEHV